MVSKAAKKKVKARPMREKKSSARWSAREHLSRSAHVPHNSSTMNGVAIKTADRQDAGVRPSPILPLLVLLPGLDGTGKSFRRFIEALGAQVKTQMVAYPMDEPLGYEELEARVWAVLPKDRPFVLLGQSFSGPVAIRIAARRPAGLRGLILCATFARNPFPGLGWTWPLARYLPLKSLPRWLRAPLMWGSRSPSSATPRAARAMSGVANEVIRTRIAALLRVDATRALRSINVPMLVLQATRDWVVSRRCADLIKRLQPEAQFEDIEGPHLLLQTQTPECVTRIVFFLKSVA